MKVMCMAAPWWRGVGCILGLALCLMAADVQALDMDRVRPKELTKETEPASMPDPERKSKGQADEQVLVDPLMGLVFLSKPESVVREGINLKGIVVDTALSKSLSDRMNDYLGRPLTLGGLHEIVRKTVQHFRSQDTPVVDVYVPEQDITRGTVQIVVVESRVGEVKAEGNRWFSSDFLVGQIALNPGEKIHGTSLLKDIDWINTNPFRDVSLVLTRGSKRGLTDIVLKTRDRRPFRAYAGYDNSGTELTGRDRYQVGFNWGNAFGLDHIMNYQFTGGEKLSRQRAHSLSYDIPLPWHHKLSFLGAASKSRPEMAPFDMEATSWEMDTRYTIPLPNLHNMRHQMQMGIDYKYSDSDLDFSSLPVFDKKTEIVQAVFGYSGTRFDRRGKTFLSTRLVMSPGKLASHNDDDDFQQFRAKATAKYAYLDLNIDRTTPLPAHCTWVMKFRGKLSGDRLLSSEQFGLGGFGSIRGFEEREAAGDSGFMVQNELHSKPVNLSPFVPGLSRAGHLTLLTFWDYGSVSSHSDADDKTLSSVGVGMRYAFGTYASLTFDYGWQDQGVKLNPDSGSRGQLSLLVSY